jgi:hypothetical protein
VEPPTLPWSEPVAAQQRPAGSLFVFNKMTACKLAGSIEQERRDARHRMKDDQQ